MEQEVKEGDQHPSERGHGGRSMTPFLTIQTASAYLPHIFRLNFLHLPLIITRRERRRSLGTTKGKAPKEGGGPEKKE